MAATAGAVGLFCFLVYQYGRGYGEEGLRGKALAMRPVNALGKVCRCAVAPLHTCHQHLLARVDGQREAETPAPSARPDSGKDTVEANQAMLAGTASVSVTQQPAKADHANKLQALT